MNTCSTCRHWNGSLHAHGACDLITTHGASGTHKAQIAGADDAIPLFITHISFGCTEHELPDDAA